MKAKVNKITIEILEADPLNLLADAIVVVTDPNLTVSDRLLQVAGSEVLKQTKQIGWCDVGSAVMTDAGELDQALKLIHAVGPRWGEGSERGKLANVTWECLRIAENRQLKSIALPAISVGTLGYPLESCANIMLTRMIDYTFEQPSYLRKILLGLSDVAALQVFEAEFERQLRDLRENGEGVVRA
ncbi:MAG: macro domain-containing protein [Chloroflexota bacterium]